MSILNEKEVCIYLNIPSIPKKKWDGTKSFKDGVAIINLLGGEESYAIATYDQEKDSEPRIKKTFSLVPFNGIKEIYVVPSYMDVEVDDMDLDEVSKEKAQALVEEAHELENEGVALDIVKPKHEYFFEHITNDEEALAFLRSYNKNNNLKESSLPTTHEGIVMRLSVIWSEQQHKQERKVKRAKRKSKK